MSDLSEERSRKRRRLSNQTNLDNLPKTLTSTISPPPLRRAKMEDSKSQIEASAGPKLNLYAERRMKNVAPNIEDQPIKRKTFDVISLSDDDGDQTGKKSSGVSKVEKSSPTQVNAASTAKIMDSVFQLTWIRDLPASSNKGAVSLKDILGDPLIIECWEFNYLHDLDFLMEAFDEDVRHSVKVNVIHGFWKNEDESRRRLKEQATKYSNVNLLTAYMPEMFGTHHSKMLVLIRADDTAQIIIHTANMIHFDWTNMSQGLWKSPFLPKVAEGSDQRPDSGKIGSGSKFRADFLKYLRAYDTKRTICKPLIDQLVGYDFSEIRAALIASVPEKLHLSSDQDTTSFGWPGLQNVLKQIPAQGKEPEIVMQISSIASLSEKWLAKFHNTLATSKTHVSKPKFKIVFPTVEEIKRSLNGYASGSAIHTKIQTPAQAKQLNLLKPMLCHWAGDVVSGSSNSVVSDAGRKRAAPHIKTYVRFADSTHQSIDWMLVTSANLSKQAWGEAPNTAGEVRVCSYEIGILVWPELFADEGQKAILVPTFKTDTPAVNAGSVPDGTLVVGARMPYDLPLAKYERGEEPWCATKNYEEPDWMGQIYGGFVNKH